MRKIGIMGAHGTGKTTLAYQLAADMKTTHPEQTVMLTESVSRRFPFGINDKATLQGQQLIFCQTLSQELEKEMQRPDVLICERTILDSLVYSQYFGFFSWVADILPYIIEHMKTYDVLYFMRHDNLFSADIYRSADAEYQQAIHMIFENWIDYYGLRCQKYER